MPVVRFESRSELAHRREASWMERNEILLDPCSVEEQELEVS